MNRRRNWWDPVEVRNLPIIPRFGHSLMLFAGIPGQPNAYRALSFLSKTFEKVINQIDGFLEKKSSDRRLSMEKVARLTAFLQGKCSD